MTGADVASDALHLRLDADEERRTGLDNLLLASVTQHPHRDFDDSLACPD